MSLVQLVLTVLHSDSFTVSKSLISAIQFTFQPSTSTEPTLNSPVTKFQFCCFTATKSLHHTTRSHNCHLHLFDVSRSYSNPQLPSLQQLKIVSYVFLLFLFISSIILYLGPGVVQWLRCCVTSQMVPGSIPSGVTGDFFRGTPNRTMCPEVNSVSGSEYQGFHLG